MTKAKAKTKIKTHKGTKKRFRLSAKGKAMHRSSGTSHLAQGILQEASSQPAWHDLGRYLHGANDSGRAERKQQLSQLILAEINERTLLLQRIRLSIRLGKTSLAYD